MKKLPKGKLVLKKIRFYPDEIEAIEKYRDKYVFLYFAQAVRRIVREHFKLK